MSFQDYVNSIRGTKTEGAVQTGSSGSFADYAQKAQIDKFKSSLHTEQEHDAIMRNMYGSYGQYVAQQLEENTSLSDSAKANLISYYGITDSDTIRKNTNVKQGTAVNPSSKASAFQNLVKGVNDGTVKVAANISDDAVTQWSNSITDVSKRAVEYLKKEGYKQPDTKLSKEIDDYLAQASDVAQYMRANKVRYQDYDKAYEGYVETTNYLRDLKRAVDSENKKFSNFKTEEDYNNSIYVLRNEDTDALKRQIIAYENAYNIAMEIYEDWEIPKAGTLNDKATNETKIITYYTQSDEDAAKKERDERLAADISRHLGLDTPLFLNDLKAEIQSKKDRLTQVQYVQNYFYLTENDVSLEEIGSHLNDANPIAYTTPHGKNVTWKKLYEDKKFEQDFNALYDEYSSKSDWAEKSKFVSQANPNGVNLEDFGKDLDLEYIHGDDSLREKITMARFGKASAENLLGEVLGNIFSSGTSSLYDYGEQYGYDSLTDKEKELATYLKYSDVDAYNEFMFSLRNRLIERHNESEVKRMYNLAQEYPVFTSAVSVGYNMASGIEYIADVALGETEDGNQMAALSSSIRQGVAEKIDWEIGNWDAFDFVYNTGMSMADSVASMAMFGKAGGVVLGLSAAAQGTNDALERGMDNKQAFWNGFMSGVFEGLFETVSIGQFSALKKSLGTGVKNIAKSIGKSMLTNASEEMLTELANIAYDNVMNADFSQYETMVRTYTMQGMSLEKAQEQAKRNTIRRVVESAASGALMGFGFGGGVSVKSYTQASSIGKAIKLSGGTGKIFDAAKLTLNGSKTNELYSEYVSKGVNESNITNAQLGNLYISAKTEANQILSSKKSTTEQKNSAKNILGKIAEVESAVNTAVKNNKSFPGAPNIDGQTTTGYNNNTNINQDKGGIDSGKESLDNRGHSQGDRQRSQTNAEAESEERRIRPENEEDFVRRVTGASQKSPRKIRRLGNTLFAYTPSEADGSEASRAVGYLKRAGIDAIYCEGSTESNKNGNTTEHNQATTSTDGKTFVSSNATLSAVQIAAHEAVHVKMYENAVEYTEYESVICDGLLWGTDEYAAVAKEIFEGYHRSKYEKENGHTLTDEEVDDIIRSPEYAPDFLIEFTAYVNEAISANSTETIEMFSKVFSNWDEVVEASRKFNEAIGLDFSDADTAAESSSTNSQSTDTDSESAPTGGRVLEMPAITVKQQNFVKKIGKALGRKVDFVNMEKFLKEHDVDTEKLKIYPDGAIDGEGNIYIWYNAEKPVQFLFKHELTHFSERSKYYKRFVEFVRGTKTYEKWMREKVKTSESYKEWLKENPKEVGKELRITQVEGFLKQDHINAQKKLNPKFGQDDALAEVIADFVGENCFGESLKGLEALIDEANLKQHSSAIQYLIDFFAYLKKKLSGNKQITFELSRIEDSFRRLISDANNTKTSDNKDGGLKYSTAKSFSEQIDDVISGTHNPRLDLYVSQTPQYLVDLNFSDGPLLIRNSKISEILEKHPEISEEILKDLPNAIKKPLLVLKSKTHPADSVVVITEIMTTKGEMIIPVWANQEGSYIDVDLEVKNEKTNFVASSYGRDIKTLLEHASKNDGFLYQNSDIEKVRQLLARNGLQLPTPLMLSDSDITVPQKAQFVKNNSMQESENYSSDENDLKFSVPTATENETDADTQSTDFTTEFKELMQSFQNGEISQDEYMQRMSELYQRSIEENGQIKPGEKVSAENKDFPVPKSVKDGTKVRQHVSRILESGLATEEQESFFEEMVLAGDFSYTPTSNKKNIKKAEETIEKEGYQKAKENWKSSVASKAADADMVAKGEALLQLAFEQKNAVDIVNLAAQLAELGTHIGQGLQAMSLVKRMGGVGQLVYLERCVARINESLKKRIKKGKAETVTIDPTLAQQLAESKTEAEFEITYAAIVKDIAAQVPPTFADKWNTMRYVCMLFSPTTHIRNLIGNAIFFPGVRIKNVLAAVMEKGVSKEERTKVVKVKKAYQEFAEKDFEEVADIITGTGKYNPSDEIRSNQRIFKSKLLEAARKFNFDMLEKEDVLFLKRHYKHALGGYLQAQGIDLREVTPSQLAKAREYAMQEALKATYRDASKLSNWLSQLAKMNAVTEIAVEGLLPFKKTPINIIKRGVEYSPIGLLKTLSKGIYDLNQGKITTAQFIDGLACGLTGTGVCIVGALLASLGVVKGGFDDEEKWFRKLNGEQEYSIEIGGKSYTIDWATPASIPLFLGVAIAEYDADEDEDILSSIWDFGMASFEPLLNLSLLSGIEDAINAASYADDGEKITSFLGTTVESYFSQFLPSLFGKAANLFDDTRRTTYIDRTSNIPVVIQEAWNKIAGKLPAASQTRAEYVDAWGETQYTGNFMQRFFQQFVSPGYASTVNITDVSEELMRLYRQTGTSGLFPSTPQKYFKIRGIRRDLSKEEYFDYATFKGQTQADLVDEAIHSEEYGKLTDEQKAEVIKDIYSYAGALAKCQLDYSYEEIASMEGEDKKGNLILTKEKYNRLNDKARQMLIDEYFMESSGNVKAYKTAKNGKSVVEYFCKRVKDN